MRLRILALVLFAIESPFLFLRFLSQCSAANVRTLPIVIIPHGNESIFRESIRGASENNRRPKFRMREVAQLRFHAIDVLVEFPLPERKPARQFPNLLCIF